jgi:hypothetical protein
MGRDKHEKAHGGTVPSSAHKELRQVRYVRNSTIQIADAKYSRNSGAQETPRPAAYKKRAKAQPTANPLHEASGGFLAEGGS